MNRIRNIKDLAELAGVSPATVSRALAGSELISLKTREKIQALADEHGFRPNSMARNLRIQRTGAIGVLIPFRDATRQHMCAPFFFAMLGMLSDELTARGYDLVLSRVPVADNRWLDRFVDGGRVDGLIVIGQSDEATTLDEVAARYRPMVAWGDSYEGQVHCSVGSNNRLGGDLATTHLIERGCRRIAFVGDAAAPETDQRLQGYRDAMHRAGLEDGSTVLPAEVVVDIDHPDLARLLGSSDERPQGIVAASDALAMILLRVLAEHGLEVPRDVSIIGYDGLALGEHTMPTLSTIDQDLSRGAANLVDVLLRRIAGEDARSVAIEPELVVRMSS